MGKLWDAIVEPVVQGVRKRTIHSVQGYDYDQNWLKVAGRFLFDEGDFTDEWVRDMQKRIYPTMIKKGTMKLWKEGDLRKGKKPPQRIAERIDQMLISAKEPQKFNTMKESVHTPTRGAEKGEKFYTWTDRSQMEKIYQGLKKNLPKMKKGKSYNVGYKSDVKKGDASFTNPGAIGLGRFQIGKGEDDIGKYMSVYDKWDIDPGVGGKTGKKFSQALLPGFEVYDRYYYEIAKPKFKGKIRRVKSDIDSIMGYLKKA